MFYGSPELYTPGDPELDAFYDSLREHLVRVGGDRYREFPHLTFGVADISVLREVEDGLSPEDRHRNGFLRYYLIDTRPSPGSPVSAESVVA
ncbi:hypothetical protein GALL_516130 [mine drainage metagenome]|uniref:Uncharacterized protein n=1 Tax=mine drainage metagenome TaxID=410659 RepID=A0A1J5PG73_9ZZZZ